MTDGLLASALEHSPESVSIYELDGTLVYLNPASERIMGRSLANARGKRLLELFPAATGTPFHAAFEKVVATGERQGFTGFVAPFDGWFALDLARVGDHVHVFARDVSATVRQQRHLDALGRISEVLTRGDLDVDATAHAAITIVSELLQADCTLAMLSSDGEWLEAIARAARDPATLELLAPVQRWPAHLGNTGEALRQRTSLLAVTNVVTKVDDALVGDVLEQYQATSVVIAPLILDDVPIGAISAARRAGAEQLTHHDRELLGQLAQSIALYMSNARRRTEATTLRSRLTALADALPALAAFVDTNERYHYVNASYERWFGRPRADYLGRTMHEMMGAPAYAMVAPHVREALTGKPQRFRAHIPYATGARDVDAQYVPVLDKAGGVMGIAALVNDVSSEVRIAEVEREHRDAERRATARLQSLLELTARLAAARTADDIARALVDGGRAAMESLAATMWQLGPDGTTAKLLRASGSLVWRLDVGQSIALDELGPVAECLRTGQPVWVTSRSELDARYPDLFERRFAADIPAKPRAFALLPLPMSDRVTTCIGFSFLDERRLSDDDRTYLEILASHGSEALRRAHALDDLVQSAQTAQRARAEAEAASRAKDEFLAMLGHELRNPLAPLVTALELMQMRGDSKFERERAVIGRQVQHLSRLVDDLLDVSRITRGKIELRRERLNISDIVAKAVEQTSPLFEERRHHLTLDIAPDLVVDGDSTRLAQVFANLLSNAAKYTPRGGNVHVIARHLGEHLRVQVRDDGIGIAPAILPHIFDLFVQAPQSSERPAGGLGLGLSIVRSLVELHGGVVTATSEGPGRGTELAVTLPAVATQAVTADSGATPRVHKAASARRILVVDDNEDAAMMLADMLDAYGHDIRTAFDGPSALRIADEFNPEVAVLDIGLPVMDGYELAQRLRAFHDVRLIAVTGYGQESDRRRSLEAGFQAHLAKPVEIDQLVQLVERG